MASRRSSGPRRTRKAKPGRSIDRAVGSGPAPPLSARTRLLYSAVEIGLNAGETCVRLYLLIYYVDVLGLRPGLAGAAVALGLLFDAITDPIAGNLSDRFASSRYGRAAWIAGGSVVMAIGFVAAFAAPEARPEGTTFPWLLSSYMVLNVGTTMIAVPHAALVNELTTDRHERSALMGWRVALANLGALIAVTLPVTLAGELSGPAQGVGGIQAMPIVALVVAGITLLAGATTSITTHRLMRTAGKSTILTARTRGHPLAPLRDRTFRPLLCAGALATIGIGINAATALHFYGYRVELQDGQIRALLIVFVGAFTIGIPGWLSLARRSGKTRPLAIGAFILGSVTTVLYPLLPPGAFAIALWAGALGLGSLVGCIVLIDSLVTDVADRSLLVTGRAASGGYFGTWKLVQKGARAIALATVGLALDASGFVPGSPLDAASSAALATLFGPCVGACFVGTGIILWLYRFDDRRQSRVQRLLQRRRDRKSEGRSGAPRR